MRLIFKNFKIAILTLVLLSTISCDQQQKVAQDYTLFHGGTILTVDDDFSEVEALVVEGDKIVATGAFKELKNQYGESANLIDLKGRTLLPGFIDPHAHTVTFAPIVALTEDLGLVNYETTAMALDRLKELASERKAGEWIMARGWDPSVQEGPSALTVKELDEVSTEHPIFILNASGHLAYVNSKAFEVAGITNDIENPSGAEYARDSDGNLNGVIKNNVAFLPVMLSNPAVGEVDGVQAIIDLLSYFNTFGVTTTSEFALGGATQSTDEYDLLLESAKRDDYTARIMAYPMYTIDEKWTEAGVKVNDGNDLARLTGFKLVADGSNQGFTGLQRKCYYNEKNFGQSKYRGEIDCNHGIAYMTVEEMTRIADKRASEGWQLAFHGNGDQAIDNILTVLDTLKNRGHDIKKLRPRIEHCSILHDDQIQKMKELGVSASFLIGHVHYWGTFMRDSVFGPEKVQLLDRCASVEKEGISFTIQSDFSVTEPDILRMVETAVVRSTYKEPDYILAPQERVSVESAIRAVTSEAAWQLTIEDMVGSLEAGKYADLVILEKDPRKVDPDEIAEIPVLETWFNGKKVYQKGEK